MASHMRVRSSGVRFGKRVKLVRSVIAMRSFMRDNAATCHRDKGEFYCLLEI